MIDGSLVLFSAAGLIFGHTYMHTYTVLFSV